MRNEKIIKSLIELIRKAETQLPSDVKNAIRDAFEKETSETAKTQLKAILTNIELAEKHLIPMCQDTGTPTFFIKAGVYSPFLKNLPNALTEAVKKATQEVPLRPNTVNPFTGVNPRNNAGEGVPIIHWELVGGSEIQVIALPKGGGSENMSFLAMLPPGVGIKGVKKFILECVIKSNGKPCPPVIVGVGIGGGADMAMELAKKAILRPVGERNKNKRVAELELELLKVINQTGIGPMGLGGETTALDVHVEWAYRHPASLPVGVLMQCWAARKAEMTIYPNGEIKIK